MLGTTSASPSTTPPPEKLPGELGKKIILKREKIPRKIYINGELQFEVTTRYLPEVGALRFKIWRFLRNQVGWNVGHNLSIGGREQEYSGTHLKGIVTDVQVSSKCLTVTLLPLRKDSVTILAPSP